MLRSKRLKKKVKRKKISLFQIQIPMKTMLRQLILIALYLAEKAKIKLLV
tara:strand:+ start:351 stop:500 length:150 start_codon:yes stop_codon:yes gene_type:complete